MARIRTLLHFTQIPAAASSALLAILDEWKSSRGYFTRMNNIRGVGTGARLNGSTFLTPGAIAFDDGAADSLSGEGGLDWYFAADGDDLIGANTGEIVDIL